MGTYHQPGAGFHQNHQSRFVEKSPIDYSFFESEDPSYHQNHQNHQTYY